MAARIPVSALCCDSLSPQHGSGPRRLRIGSSGKERSPRNDSLGTFDDSDSSEDARQRRVDDWFVAPRYEPVSWLGHGSFGRVIRARDTQTNQKVAIKRIQGIFDDDCFCRQVAREVSLLRLLQHPCLVRLVDVVAPGLECGSFNEVYIVMETCHSDLRKFCESPEIVVDLDLAKRMMWTLLLGLTYLHSACVWHRDLKPGNCLLTEHWSVKIADFGLARAVGRTQQFHQRGPEGHAALYDEEGNCNLRRDLTRQVGTRAYRAPEMILRQRRYTEMVDVWSAGCVYAELLWTVAGAEGCRRRGDTLFHGRACCPVSDDCPASQAGDPSKDILSDVFDLIGTPTEAEVERTEGERAREYLRSFPRRQGRGFQAEFPHADQGSIDILRGSLCFDPDARLTARELLHHGGVFDRVHENDEVSLAPGKIDWPYDVRHVGDKEVIRAVLVREILKMRL